MRFVILIGLQFMALSLLAQQKAGMNREIAAILADIKSYNQKIWKRDSSRGTMLGSRTEEYIADRASFYQTVHQRLRNINKTTLSFDDQINLDLLSHEVLDELSTFQYKLYLNPILSDWGFHTSLATRARVTFRSKKEAEQYLAMLKDIPRYVDENLQLMRKGLAMGISQPKIILDGYEATYLQHLVDSVEKSVFWNPFLQKPAAITIKDWDELKKEGKRLITDNVIGSYRKISDFFSNHYLPKTRSTVGASSMPEGRAFYEDRVRHYTTTNLSSEDIYKIGLKEVARIRSEMDSVIKAAGFSGTFKEFITYLRTDSRFYPKTAEELLKEAAFIAKQVDGKLPSLFGKLPRQPYTVTPVPGYLAPSFTTGRYSGAPITSTRAGEYWVNTYNLQSRTLYTLEALTLHEAVPGHHLQTTLTQELQNLPEFRRNLYINAFGEGWGLYAEYLGHEMGFYKDPYSLFGRLTYEMWRACRLVIDVGLHVKGWTRDQAVSYLADHTALSLHEVNTEVNRYISWPGQALAYKIGEIRLKELRKKTEAALKEDFDVRAFHDMILCNGTVTLSLLDQMTDRFIEEQLKKNKRK